MTETRRERRHRLAGPDYYPSWHPVVIGRRLLRLYVRWLSTRGSNR